ncbi:diaminopimelate decarboxylase, partial [Streptococcus suis]
NFYDYILTPAGIGHINIFTELGRFLLDPHGNLITKVLHRKETYLTYIGVDASDAKIKSPAFYGAYHNITNITRPHAP